MYHALLSNQKANEEFHFCTAWIPVQRPASVKEKETINLLCLLQYRFPLSQHRNNCAVYQELLLHLAEVNKQSKMTVSFVHAEYPNGERFHLHYADLIDFGSLCSILRSADMLYASLTDCFEIRCCQLQDSILICPGLVVKCSITKRLISGRFGFQGHKTSRNLQLRGAEPCPGVLSASPVHSRGQRIGKQSTHACTHCILQYLACRGCGIMHRCPT